jgi:hypothetical protein
VSANAASSSAPARSRYSYVRRDQRTHAMRDETLMKKKAGQGFWPLTSFLWWSCRESNPAAKPGF